MQARGGGDFRYKMRAYYVSSLLELHFGWKKTEFLDKSSKTIDILPVFFQTEVKPSTNAIILVKLWLI